MPDVVVAHPVRHRHRTGRTVVSVVDAAGRPLAHTEVRVAQRRHHFGFGSIGFDLLPLATGTAEPERNVFGGASGDLERLADLFLGLFDVATLPFYWRGFEPRPGEPDTQRLVAAARWFADHGVAVKGHPLVWHTLAPTWLLPMTDDEVLDAVRARVTREVAGFAGLVDTWDAVNEAVIMPVFTAEENAITRLAQRLGRVATIRTAFDTARAANPRATLLLNDFDLSARYERLIEECLEAGIRIDALGLQTHMHQGYWGEERVLATVDRFARFGLPLHLTETSLVSGHLMPPEIDDLNDYRIPCWPSTPEGEERQADEVVRHYTSLFGHPAVHSVTYWGLTDDGAWLGAPSGLVRADGTPKPAYEQLRDLVRGQWWLAPTDVRTDADGRFTLDAYLGDYTVSAGPAVVEVTLTGDTPVTTARLAG